MSAVPFAGLFSDSVHFVEDVFVLAADVHANGAAKLLQASGKVFKFFCTVVCVHNHHHIEKSLDNGLSDVQNIYIIFCQICTNPGNDSYGVFSYNSDNCFFHDL